MNAADYIGVPALVDHGTTYVAEKISGKQPSEVAEFLNVKEDFPKETIDELTQMLEKIEKPENNGQETAQNENDDRQPEGEETKEWNEPVVAVKIIKSYFTALLSWIKKLKIIFWAVDFL